MTKYKVIKEYCGIEKGTTVENNDPITQSKMIAKGHWQEVKAKKGDAPKNKAEKPEKNK